MGVYFNIEVTVHGADTLEVVGRMREINTNARRALNEDGTNQDAIKWYDFDEFFQSFSADNPGLILDVGVVSSEGPEWHNVYQDGTVETFVCEKSFPGLDDYLEFCRLRRDSKAVGGVKGGD